jgi:hypothetical protein
MLLPRHLEIIFEINRRLLESVRRRFPGDEGGVARVSLIEERPTKHVRMANLYRAGKFPLGRQGTRPNATVGCRPLTGSADRVEEN